MGRKAFAPVILILVLVGLLAAGGIAGYLTWGNVQRGQRSNELGRSPQANVASTSTLSMKLAPATASYPVGGPCSSFIDQSNQPVYINPSLHFTFKCSPGISWELVSDQVLNVLVNQSTSITLTVDGPPVPPFSPAQTVARDTTITINDILMRKRGISDPPIGYPSYQNQEVIYDFKHGEHTFTWWAIFKTSDAASARAMDTIITSFKFWDPPSLEDGRCAPSTCWGHAGCNYYTCTKGTSTYTKFVF